MVTIKKIKKLIDEELDVFIDDCDHNDTYDQAVAIPKEENQEWALVEEQKKEYDKFIKENEWFNEENPTNPRMICVDDLIILRKVLFGDSDNENNTNKR